MSGAPTGSARILLVAGHPIVRFRVRRMVESDPDLSIYAEIDTDDEAREALATAKADLAIVIVELSPGLVGGLHRLRELHEVNPRLPILVISPHDEMVVAEQALRAGARAYLMTQHAEEMLPQVVRHVLAGRVYVSERVLQNMLARIVGNSDSKP